jgi:hypothetical protein
MCTPLLAVGLRLLGHKHVFLLHLYGATLSLSSARRIAANRRVTNLRSRCFESFSTDPAAFANTGAGEPGFPGWDTPTSGMTFITRSYRLVPGDDGPTQVVLNARSIADHNWQICRATSVAVIFDRHDEMIYTFNFNSRSALPWANFSRSVGDSGTLSRKARPAALLSYG